MGFFMKRIFLFLLVLFSITACSPPQKADNKVVIEFWTLQLGAYEEYINGLITEYESIHPDVKIKWLDVPFKEGEKRTLAAAMSNRVPDVVNLNPIFSSTLASKKALVNFNDYLTEEQKNKYLPAAWKACSLGDFAFGIPWYITSSITIYNEKDLQAAGIKAPPKNYDELISQSKIIKAKLNKYAFLPSLTEGDYFLKILIKNGVKVVSDSDPSKAIFNSKEAVSILEEWVNLYNNEIISPESIVSTHQNAVDKFQSGVNTYIFIGPNFLKTIKDNSPKLYKHINISPQVVGSTGKVDFSVMNFIVPIKSKHKKEAVDFALFVTNSKNQLKFSKLTPTLPSSIEALEDSFFTENKSKTIEEEARIISASQLKAGAESVPVLRSNQELISVLNFYIQKAMLKKLSPVEALNQAVKKWNDILSS